ncbi:MAG TPA: hypothetical protein VHT91_20935 [Kofleriaceae bacterium]|nr:hypothetical protein [Kofleriaceae bacterium]
MLLAPAAGSADGGSDSTSWTSIPPTLPGPPRLAMAAAVADPLASSGRLASAPRRRERCHPADPRNHAHLSRRQTMANDSSLIDIDALALERIHGGMIPIPGGGGYVPPAPKPRAPKPPAGGSLTLPGGKTLSCPAGSAPYYTSISGTASEGVGPFHIGQHVTVNQFGCEKIK